MLEYLPELLKGLHTSLTLTVASIAVALVLALVFTIILTLKTPFVVWLVRGYITLLPVRRCWCKFPDLLRTRSIPDTARVSATLASTV